MPLVSLRSILSAIAAFVLLSGCASYPRLHPFFKQIGASHPPVPAAAQLEPPPVKKAESYWDGEGVKGAPAIVVRLGEQRAYFYRGRKVVGETRISTGKRGYTTPAGSYSVIQKDRNHVSTLYGDYVGAGGDVVKANVSVGKDPAPVGATFRGARMALLPALQRRPRSALRPRAKLPGVAWLRSVACGNGETLLRECRDGYAGAGRGVRGKAAPCGEAQVQIL